MPSRRCVSSALDTYSRRAWSQFSLVHRPGVSPSSSRGIALMARVQAEASGSKMRDLQQPADNHDVLEKMDHLILIGEIPVKEDRRCQSEHGEAERDLSRTKAEHQQQTATDLEGNGNRPAERGQRQADTADIACRCCIGGDLAEAAHEKRQADKQATKQR